MSENENAVTTQDRSPKYPRLFLADAIARVKKAHEQIGKSTVSLETLAQALGYKNAVAGATQVVIAALTQYGLLARSGDRKYSISSLAIRILHPTGEPQYLSAIQEAALKPAIFTEIRDNYHECSEQILISHLVQSRFTPDGAERAAAIYKQNAALAKLDLAHYAKPNKEATGADTMPSRPIVSREPLGQFAYPKPTSDLPDTTAPPLRLSSRYHVMDLAEGGGPPLAKYSVPLGTCEVSIIFTGEKIYPEDFDHLKDIIDIFKKQYERRMKVAEQKKSDDEADRLETQAEQREER